MEDNDLIEKIANYVDRPKKDITSLVASMSYQDLVMMSKAIRDGNEEDIYTILHGYGL